MFLYFGPMLHLLLKQMEMNKSNSREEGHATIMVRVNGFENFGRDCCMKVWGFSKVNTCAKKTTA